MKYEGETAYAYTRRVLKNGGKAKKALGQNFLIDDGVLRGIVEQGIPDDNLPVVEIGPGPGGLTRELLRKFTRLWAVELDKEKIDLLEKEYAGASVRFIHMNALDLNLSDLWGEEKGWLVGNLPYYITNPLLKHFLGQEDYLLGMTVMVQKEVAERIMARPGGRDYGILSIATQLCAEVRKIFDVLPDAFWPQPKVTSTVLRLDIRPYPGFVVSRELFFQVVRAAFAQRRKNLLNALAGGLKLPKREIEELLEMAALGPNLRAEDLSIDDYQKIVKVLAEKKDCLGM